ncbi:MAG: class I SAM-dependent methyltransferase, partial [Bacteroidetes bacterium]
ARRQGRIHTFEGCPETAEIAQKNFKILDVDNIKIHVGNIDKTLPALLPKVGKVDVAYLDANHQYEPTLRYFSQILPAMSEEGLLIFDDIHWSEGMQRAWQEVVAHPEVSLSVDLFAFGLAFVSKKYSKEHFVLRF